MDTEIAGGICVKAGDRMVVSHNLAAMNAQRQYKLNTAAARKSTEKLSSGYKVNRAADDAAGLTISEKMRSMIRGLNQGAENIEDGISLCQIADGALAEVHDILQRMNELSVQAANDTNTAIDRQAIQNEMNELAVEITRIGKSTTYNTMHIFDDAGNMEEQGAVTALITSPSAEKGYLSEPVQIGGLWHPASTLDFSRIDSSNIEKLNGQGFSFNCSESCAEVFDFTFTTDGTPSSASNLSGKVHHYYNVDISGCTDGSQVVDKLFQYVSDNPPNGLSLVGDVLGVSHSNSMKKGPDGKSLIVYANQGMAMESAARTRYAGDGGPYGSGKIDCTRIMGHSGEMVNTFQIQCSSVQDDCEAIHTYRMNAEVLGVDRLSVMSHLDARGCIDRVNQALDKVSGYRTDLGASQNRLEHSYNNVNNTSENLQAAETQIRDADMAKEMVEHAKQNILMQAGQSMMAQANQSTQGILSLLQ